MKAAVLHEYDEKLEKSEFVVYEDVPDPRIEGPNDVIVRIGGEVAAQFLGSSGRDDAVGLALFLLVLLAAGWASQRWIEAPAQRLGRRLTRPPAADPRLKPRPVTASSHR